MLTLYQHTSSTYEHNDVSTGVAQPNWVPVTTTSNWFTVTRRDHQCIVEVGVNIMHLLLVLWKSAETTQNGLHYLLIDVFDWTEILLTIHNAYPATSKTIADSNLVLMRTNLTTTKLLSLLSRTAIPMR